MSTNRPGQVLIFSACNGYRHESLPDATAALEAAGPSHDIEFHCTEDATHFNDRHLAQFDAILFLMVIDRSEESPEHAILNDEQQQALQEYLNRGGGFIGIHSASVCLYRTPFYGRHIGAYFDNHPEIAPVTFLNNIEPTHPTVKMIPSRWSFTEEVYNFRSDPRDVGSKVVLTIDQPDGDPYAQIHGSPHPIAWYQERGAGAAPATQTVGRSFYTSLGHLSSTWKDPTFMEHIMAGVMWALGSKANSSDAADTQSEHGTSRTTTLES